MNWEAVGAIGEVVGAVAVIATLLYLAIQIRQNTKAVMGATLNAITERKQFELRWSSDISIAWRKSLSEPENLSEDEHWQMAEWMSACFVARENEFFQFKHGLIDEDTWAASENIIRMAISSSWARKWWEEFGTNAFTGPFIDVVNNVLDLDSIDYAKIVQNIENQ